MDTKRIEQLILEHIQIDNCECGNVLEVTVSTAAAAIAQAHKEEVAKMEHRYQQANQMDRDIAGMARLDMEKAQAQVAVMAEALRALVADPEKEGQDALGGNGQGSYCVYCLTDDYNEHMTDCPILQGRQALSAAPKVLARRKAAYWPEDDTLMITDGMDAIDIGYLIDEGRVLADVLVLAHEQGQDSEHPSSENALQTGLKAKTVDREQEE